MVITGIVQILAYLLMFLGLIGAILPLVPDAPLIWLGVLIWAWADGFQRIGWPTVCVLAIMTGFCMGTDLIVTSLATRKAGAGWERVGGAIVGGLVGAVLLGGLVPIVGALVGTLLGAGAGILLVEYRTERDWRGAARAAAGYITGFLLAAIVRLAICLSMIAIFVWRAFL